MDKLLKFSNPAVVIAKGKKLGLDVLISNRKDKKYAIRHPKTNKLINFGQMNYEDFTKHGDEKRRQLFISRNNKWKDAKPYTPAFLSYYLLW
jgi:hypothetical protein